MRLVKVEIEGCRVECSLFALFFLAVASATAQGSAPERSTYVSQLASLSFRVPEGLEVHEREIFTDAHMETPGSVVVLRLVPNGLSEEGSLGTAAVVQIEAFTNPAAMRVDQWVAARCGLSLGAQAAPDSREEVGGEGAVRRQIANPGPGEGPARLFVTKGLRAYHFSSGPRTQDHLALEELLEGVRFDTQDVILDLDRAVREPSAAVGLPRVRMVYLVPSDVVVPDEGYRLGIERAIRQLQVFYRSQIGDGRAFSLNEPVVEILQTSHPVSWYTTDAPSASPEYRFWNAATADGLSALGGTVEDPQNRFIFYIDAQPLCGQIIGGGSGVALLGRGDLSGVTCDAFKPFCPPEGPDLRGLCRWVGGLGHELGHAFNLPHPTPGACPGPDTSCRSALMWSGYDRYPSAYLLAADKSSLVNSPQTAAFFTPLDPGPLPYACTNGCPPARPTGLTALAGGAQVSLAWNAAAAATSYTLRRSTGTSSGPYVAVAAGLVARSHTDAPVANGEAYFYVVNAVNGAGDGPNSNLASAAFPGTSISSVVPNSGSTGGGTTVTISGAGFVPGASLTIGGTPLTSLAIVGPHTLTGVTGPHGTAIADIVATIPGPFTATLRSGYFYFDLPAPGKLFTVAPCRQIDTRDANLGGPDPLAAATRRNFTLTGSRCGVPATATAVSVNLTVVGPAAPGFVSLFPGNGIPAQTSNINFAAGQTRANNAMVLLSTDGLGSLAVLNGSAGVVHVILDVNGYLQ